MIDLVDALRELLEPASAEDATIGESGCRLDLTCAAPFDYEPDTFYGYEESDVGTLDETLIETGGGTVGFERRTFEIVFVYVVKNEGENAEHRRSREVSVALDERRAGYLRAVRGLRVNGDVWHHIIASADADYVRQLEVRGIAIRITGYRFVS